MRQRNGHKTRRQKPSFSEKLGFLGHPAAIGMAVTLLFVLILHLALAQAGLWTWSSLLDTSYLFWLGIPALVYIMAALVASRAWQPEVRGQMSA
jgi:hypothetical protein